MNAPVLVPAPTAETAGFHRVGRVPIASIDEQVGAVRTRLVSSELDAVDVVYVTDDERGFAGAVPTQRLCGAPPTQRIGELVDRGYPRVTSGADQEHVAARAVECGALSVAVLDQRGRLLGAVPAGSLIEILRREHVEDLHRLAGIQREDAQTREALEAPPARRARHRLPWLVVGLGGSMLAAGIVSRFELVLERELAIAYFVPAIVYLADAIGTQTEAIAVRGLSLDRVSLRTVLGSELRTGLLIGVCLAVLAVPIVLLGFGNASLAAAVGIAILVAGAAATTIGLVLPWCLHRWGSDPAYGSGPLATIAQDVLSLVIYLAIAGLLVR